jgi:TonB family protein
MRDELHLMELVDRYLDGAMGDAERMAFEERMRTSNELRGIVDDQRALREGLHRVQLRGAVSSAHRAWMVKRWIPWAVAGLFVVAASGGLMRMGAEEAASDEVIHEAAVPVPKDTAASNIAIADTVLGTVELQTRVETIFMRTRTPSSRWADTCQGEGRIVTHLITRLEGGKRPDTLATSGTANTNGRADIVDAPFTAQQQQYGAEDHWTMTGGIDTVPAPTAPTTDPKPLLATVEVLENASQPVFPGGMDELQRFINENIKQPRGSRKSGVVTVSFTVNKKGEVLNAEVVRSLGRAFDAEAMRLVGSMPAWEPSRLGDRPVKSRVNVLFRFDGRKSLPAADRPREDR